MVSFKIWYLERPKAVAFEYNTFTHVFQAVPPGVVTIGVAKPKPMFRVPSNDEEEASEGMLAFSLRLVSVFAPTSQACQVKVLLRICR